MGRLDSNAALATSLNNNEPFLYAHLVKFERPLAQIKELPNGEIRYETDATRYAYITDAAYDINFDDGSTNLAGTANGTQTYRANKLLKVGGISESSAIKIASMNLQLNAAAVDASIAGTFTITSAGALTVTNGLGFVEAGFQEGDRIKFSSGNNSTIYLRITSFTASNVAQVSLLTLKDAAGDDETITAQTGFSATLSLESDEIVALLRETLPTNFVNRNVFIYKIFLEAENPNTGIGNPILLFKGIITTATYKEDQDKAIATWGIKSHWGDFKQIRGRLTSDDFHRALKPNSKGQLVGNPQATIRPEYADDKGFAHAEQAINVIGTYMTKVTKGKMVKRGGLAGLFGGKKWKEWEEDVEREVDLRFDLQAKYLPVVYGVRRLNGNLVFADTSATEAGQVFIGEALCEGPIHGIYNIYVEDSSLVCIDEPDSDVRKNGGEAVDVACIGRTDKGDVMGGNSISSISQLIAYINANDISGVFGWHGGNDMEHWNRFKHRGGANGTRKADYSKFDFVGSKSGLTHNSGFKINVPTSVDVEFKAGTADQQTSRILLTQAHGDKFKLEVDYWGDDGSGDYWSDDHQLLDTAYVVTRNTLTEEQTDIPDLEYVVKGKILDCYNYDGSYAHDSNPAYSSESATNFKLGDTVTLKNSSNTNIEADVMIIDKWTHDAGDYGGYRFRWDWSATNQGITNESFKNFYMTDGTNNWHMVTHDYQVSLTVAETYIEDLASADTSAAIPLKVTLTSPSTSLELGLGSGLRMVTLIDDTFNAAIGSTFDSAYDAATNIITLTASKSAGMRTDVSNVSALLTNKIALSSGASTTDDYYNGATIILTKTLEDGNELDITKIVEDYDGTNKIITVTEPFSAIVNDNNIAMFPENRTGEDPDKITIMMGQDKRVSTNPALITYDYLTSKRYGPGIKQEDLNQNSFLNAGITCDTGSDITVTLATAATFLKGAVYKWVSGVFKWQGTVLADSSGSTTSVTFTNCVGKLTNKWNNWETKAVGDLVWGLGEDQLYRVTTAGVQTAFNDSTGPGTATSQLASFDLARVSVLNGETTSPATLAVDANGGNPVRYTLYDHDDIKYWKYLGWESHDQRWVTRHQANIIIRTERPVFDNISALLEHYNGLLTYADGKYVLTVETAKDEATEGTSVFNDTNSNLNIKIRYITDEDIIGAINIKDKGLDKSFNSLSASINDPQNSFNGRAVSFFNSDYLKKDRGIVKSTSFKMPGITNYYNARMAVKQLLDQSRFNREISFTMRPAGIAMMCGELIRIKYPRFGWDDGKYWRIKNLTLNENCLVNVVAEEYEDEVYLVPSAGDTAFKIDASTEAITRTPSAPTNLTATTGGTEVIGQINLSWTEHATSPPPAASGYYEIWGANTQSGNANTLVTAHATHITDVAADVVSYVDKPKELSGNFYYWVRAANTMLIQTTAGRELKSYYGDFTSDSNTGALGTTVSVQQVKVEAQDYSIIYDAGGINPAYTGTGANIVITATPQGYNNPEYEFRSPVGTIVRAFSTTATYNFAVPSGIFSPSKVIQVGVREGSSGAATQTDNISITAVQSGSPGTNAKLVVVTADEGNVMRVTNGYSAYSDGYVHTVYVPTVITVSGNTTGTTDDGVWRARAANGTTNLDSKLTVVVSGHANPSCKVTSGNIEHGMKVRYTLHADDGSSYDEVTLLLLDDLTGTTIADFSNQTHVLGASSAGAVSDFSGSGTTIKVYEGPAKLDYDGGTDITGGTGGATAGHWNITRANVADIGEGALSTSSGTNSRHAVIGNITSVDSDVDTYEITYLINGKNSAGEAFDTITKVQTITKSKTGDDGSSAYTVIMPNNNHTLPVSNAGTVSFTGSGTIIEVLRGGTELEGILSGTPGNDEFVVTGRVVSPAGAFDTSGTDNSGLGAITQAAGAAKHLVVADFDEINAGVTAGTVTYTLKLGSGDDMQTVDQVQSINKSQDGTDGTDGAAGAAGLNNATAYLYQVSSSNSAPADPNGDLTYTFSTAVVSGSNFNGWSVTRPVTSEANPYRWVIAAAASSAATTDTIATGEWAGAVLDSAEGFQSATIYLYQRTSSATSPAVINDDSIYTFSTKILTNANGLDNWSTTIPASGGDYIHVTTAVALAVNSATTDTIATGDWATPTTLAQKGDTGINSASISLYKLNNDNENAPAVIDSNTTYTFETAVLSGQLDGWSRDPPNTTDTNSIRWWTVAIANSNSATDTIATGDWATPIIATNDADMRFARVDLYQRAASSTPPADPDGDLTWTFSTGVISGSNFNGWTKDIPASGNDYVFVISAAALGNANSLTDTIATGDWSAASLITQPGVDGAAGSDAKTVDLTVDDYSIIYNAAGASPSPSGNMTLTATSQNFTNGYFKFTGDGITDETSFTDGSGANADTFTFAIPSSHFTAPKSLRVGVSEGNQSEVAFDTITISAVKPGIAGVDGSDGEDGAAGLNSASVSLYRKNTSSSSAPSAFSGTFTYTFATGAVTGGTLNSWTTAVPSLANGEYAWVRQAVASNTGATDSISIGEWSTAVVHSGVGSDGASITGASGNSNALVTLYRASTTNLLSPTAFTGTITYTFATGGVTTDGNFQSWTPTAPTVAQGSFLWVRQATASANTATDTIAIGNWSAAVVTSASGDDGAGIEYIFAVTADSGTSPSAPNNSWGFDQPSSPWFDAAPAVTTSNKALWRAQRAIVGNPSAGAAVSANWSTAVVSGRYADDGTDGMSFILTNASHTFPASVAGAVSSYSSSGTIIEVYEGATALLYDGTGTANSRWKIVAATTNITVGSFTDSGAYVTVADHSGVASGTDTSQIIYTISGKRADGSAFSTTSKQTFTKSKAGTDGTDGAAGLNTATVALYRKNTSSSSAPSAFSGTFTYTFATGAVTNGTLNSWTTAVPSLANGEYAWVRQATASASTSTDTVPTSEFSTAVVHSGVGSDGASITGAAGNSNALVALYRVSTDGSSAPSAFSGTFTYTFATGAVTGGTLNSWTATVPTVPQGSYLWIRQATASANTATDTIATSEFSTAAVISASGSDGTDGAAGLNTATVALYRKNTSSSSAPSAFSGTFTYTFATGAVTNGTLNSWTTTVPDLSAGEYAWVRLATASANTATDSVPTSEFAAAVVHSGVGSDGASITGAAGNSNALVALYRVSTDGSSAPTAFSGTFTYTFATGAVTNGTLNSWTTTIPTVAQGSFLWVRQATASANTATDTIATSEFSAAAVASASGEDGEDGAAGLNTATVGLYNKNTSSSSAPSAFSGTFTYTFATGAITNGTLNSWTTAVPALAAGEYAWVRQATASANTATDTIATSEFSTAVMHSGVGSDGASITGAAGNSNALVALYRVSTDGSSAPSAFSGTFTYTFATGAITNGTLNSWTTTIPTVAQGSFLWVRQATASANTATDTIATSEFSAAAVASASGSDGDPGDAGAGTTTIYYIISGTTAPTTPSAGTDSTPGSWTATVPNAVSGSSRWFSLGNKAEGGTTWTWGAPQMYQSSDNFAWGTITITDGLQESRFTSLDGGTTYSSSPVTGELSIVHPTLGTFKCGFSWTFNTTSDTITAFALSGVGSNPSDDYWSSSTFAAGTSEAITVTHQSSGYTIVLDCSVLTITLGGGGSCFLPGTLVEKENGIEIEIENLEIGDKVRGGTIIDKQSYQTDYWYKLNGLNLTAGHPVWIEDKGWSCIDPEDYYKECKEFGHKVDLDPKRIEVGDKTTAGEIDLLERIEGQQEVWNITVDTEHTYYVNGILVHNGGK